MIVIQQDHIIYYVLKMEWVKFYLDYKLFFKYKIILKQNKENNSSYTAREYNLLRIENGMGKVLF